MIIMILGWQKEFTENQILNGIDLIDDITEIDKEIDALSGTVNENGDEYWVNIDLNDDFTIKSMKCSCKKRRCHHMAAVLYSDMENFKKDIDSRVFLEDIDNDNLMNFLKNQLITNWECQQDFIEEFRFEMLKNDKLQIDDKLFLILRYPKCNDLLADFIRHDLAELYEEDPREAFYLIISMFYKVLSDISYYKDSQLMQCWHMIEEMIIGFSKIEPDLVKNFTDTCREEGYEISYLEFRKLLSKIRN